jgi:hypothetical protein
MLKVTSVQVARAGAAELARAGDLAAASRGRAADLRIEIIIKSSGLKSRWMRVRVPSGASP